MKTGPDAAGTAENGFGSANQENETRRPRYRRNRVFERKTWKRDPTPSIQSRTGPGAQNKKTGPDIVGTAENGSGSAKHKKRDPTPLVPLKMRLGAQSMKTGPDAIGTAQNGSWSAKHENGN
jgi:hypothetical protein